MTSRSVRRSRVAAAALSALAVACTEDRSLIGPPVRTGPTTSASVQILLTAPATFSLRTPISNTDVMGWTPTAIQIGAGQPVRVTVSGTLEFQANPVRVNDFGPPPTIPLSIGPAGAGFPWYGSEEVVARIRRPDGSVFPVDLNPQSDPGAASTQGVVQGPGELEVARPIGIAGGASCQSYPGTHGCPNATDYEQADDYLVSGEQTLTAEPLDTARIVATPSRVQTAGDTATFAISLSWTDDWFVPPLQPWLWVPLSGAPPRDAFCGSERTCRFPVSEPGRMEVGVSAARGVVNFRVQGPTIQIGPAGPPPDSGIDATLVAKVRLAGRSVTPVLADNFNAVDQSTTPERRSDTVTVAVRVSLTPGARPATGATVTLISVPVPRSGGHVHDRVPRPGGTFFLPGEDVSMDGRPAGRDSTITLQVADTAELRVIYRSSGVAGVERILARVTRGRLSAADADSLVIQVAGLVELREEGSVDTVGVLAEHPDSHWGTPTMVARLREAADSFQAQFGIQLRVNDMSLPLGGVFDLGLDWAPQHFEHRAGTSADISTDRDPAMSTEQLKYLAYQWRRLNESEPLQFIIHDERNSTSPHWHFRVRGD